MKQRRSKRKSEERALTDIQCKHCGSKTHKLDEFRHATYYDCPLCKKYTVI